MTPESRPEKPVTEETSGSGSDAEQKSPEEIQAEIEATREEMGDTVAAVAEKADVKKQAKAKVGGVKEAASAKTAAAKESVAAKTEELSDRATDAIPDSAGAGIQQAQQFAQENPVPLAIAGALIAGFALGRLVSR